MYELVDEQGRLVLRVERQNSIATTFGFGSKRLRYTAPDGMELASADGSTFTFHPLPQPCSFGQTLGTGIGSPWYANQARAPLEVVASEVVGRLRL